MGKYSFPPGFRFHPTDVELVKYHLKRKILGKKFPFEAIAEINIYKHAPWDLPDMSSLKTRDLKWFFFCPVEKKYARGARFNRATEYGYWKTTGKDRPVMYNDEVVGMIKTLIFHQGKAPHGDRTDWVMHEYRLEEKELAHRGIVQDAYVLCVVFKKDGMGPRNGAQYGAPFKEEDWSDDEEDSNLVGPSCMSTLAHVPQSMCTEASVELSGLYTLPPSVNTHATSNVTADIVSNVPPPVITTETNAALSCLDSPQVLTVFPTMAVPIPMVADPKPEAVPVVVDAKAAPVVADAETVSVLMEATQPAAQVPNVEESNDDILFLLDIFTDDEAFMHDNCQMTANAHGSFFDDIQGCAVDDEMTTMLACFREDNNWNNAFDPL